MKTNIEDGARIGVIGGGPAGSLFAYFLLTFARRLDLDVCLDIYEPRDFTRPGAAGCNMCGGIVSESLVQALAIDGIALPPSIVQRGIDSYVLHTDTQRVRIDTPLDEKRIAALYRGGGPRDITDRHWRGLDSHLLGLAEELGAHVHRTRVREVGWDNARPQVRLSDRAETYDLLAFATGVNSNGLQLLDALGLPARRFRTAKAYVTEINLGHEVVGQTFGNSMHMFLINVPRLDCAAIIPKGDYVTVCLLGRDIDRELIGTFFGHPAVRRCFADPAAAREGVCHCSPKINIGETSRPFVDRVVLLGDCGATRLYKDGIGAAYRTAKAAARTAIFSGVAARDFRKHYWPVYRSIAHDNRFGLLMFAVVHWIKAIRPLVAAVVTMSAREQEGVPGRRRMSMVLWDMFTGSAPYREIFLRTLAPPFIVRFAWESCRMAMRRPKPAEAPSHV